MSLNRDGILMPGNKEHFLDRLESKPKASHCFLARFQSESERCSEWLFTTQITEAADMSRRGNAGANHLHRRNDGAAAISGLHHSVEADRNAGLRQMPFGFADRERSVMKNGSCKHSACVTLLHTLNEVIEGSDPT